ncbi:hypothetical protein [Halomonas cerina]|uniref:Uncharacterized protein n=1 Tax=Halomonas cerina TaxID=447424 RepID=A0A839VGQ3_9GAMM|nr:hypothetical protein [Halomonas cerina]MBB3192499.1 hypothetical protein [Halomonas cerina]
MDSVIVRVVLVGLIAIGLPIFLVLGLSGGQTASHLRQVPQDRVS